MINRVTLIGRLGNNPEIRYLESGNAVCTFSIATSEKWKDKSGEMQESTEWHRIVCWGRQAEICNEHLEKGKTVYVEGKITTRKWQDDNGQERMTTEIQAQQVKFL